MLYQLSYCPLQGRPTLSACLEGPSSPSGCPWTADAIDQRVSLWTVCLRSCEQYFFISSRSRSLILDFIVM